ncbi:MULTISPECIES: hypothetical protein [unclassified Dehalobacter]|uniref:hypothetical protein n=1 Tax=unclassified Dehalobacter TaxID=2635733 RepID=UPI00104E0F25|nr:MULTISPECIES: hypothetical protein [unclassified Dehalobacter]TCX51910.1 hypothetical protein C1I36_06215 [Dehalobacter sp. 14DCB1]TCX52970.1 hypothetical protein C1I38_07895 [Dehalobacter sp. 12DCB1]
MKSLKMERYEEHTLLLEEGIDYHESDLVPDVLGTTLRHLPSDKLTQIAKDKGFDKWTFSGWHNNSHEDKETQKGTVVKFAKFI